MEDIEVNVKIGEHDIKLRFLSEQWDTDEWLYDVDLHVDYRYTQKYCILGENSVSILLMIRALFYEVLKQLPDGQLLRASAHIADTKGKSRYKLLRRMGFGLVNREGGDMYARLTDGKLKPVNDPTFTYC